MSEIYIEIKENKTYQYFVFYIVLTYCMSEISISYYVNKPWRCNMK